MAQAFYYGSSNFDEPLPWTNRRDVIWGMVITFMIMSWLCAIFRFYVRFKIVHSLGWDDLFLAGTVLAMTAGSISTCLSVHYGLGQHFLLLDPQDIPSYLLTFYISNACYNLATSFIKLALLFQFLRIFERGTIAHRAAQCLIVFTALWSVAYCFLAWFPCSPVRKIWLGDAVPGRCYGYGAPEPGPFVATYISHGAINVALDVLTLLVPLPLLRKASSTRADRLRVAGLLAMGLVVLAIAGWRLQTIVHHQAATYPTRDPTWYAPVTFVLAAVEVDIAAICASIPIFWPVISTLQWGKIFITHEIRVTREDRVAVAGGGGGASSGGGGGSSNNSHGSAGKGPGGGVRREREEEGEADRAAFLSQSSVASSSSPIGRATHNYGSSRGSVHQHQQHAGDDSTEHLFSRVLNSASRNASDVELGHGRKSVSGPSRRTHQRHHSSARWSRSSRTRSLTRAGTTKGLSSSSSSSSS
ncbi:uncharacterized protein B0I36DRAFT_388492 [Microdochium trichocladiopsis]|uniref:Rhodopsin domain-containing protein n=1 Tax=Microdochium trichocladiopsis TaxID=1682393 RepID=A0A9P9BJK5_9PEZI|nr:uncharacterized protein B0I36DRAFT_388492 [Microdochium trichocladiopsis]KAH7018243.1 hypothetical protein B0I36DRAFT_388492 [Microdochium trichocladiopsis]